MGTLRSQLRTYLLTREARDKKHPQFEVFIAILNVYAKQNNKSQEEVLSHIFEELTKPMELQKFRKIARDLQAKSENTALDQQRFPNLAFLQNLNS